jgi:hypothetical protein
MAQPPRQYFASLTILVQVTLDKTSFTRLHFNPDRAIWEVHGFWEGYDIRLKEIFTELGRMYSYYVINDGQVVVGFDNYPDRRVLRQKYGAEFTAHLSQLIPHKHGARKITVELTETMDVKKFLDYLDTEIKD